MTNSSMKTMSMNVAHLGLVCCRYEAAMTAWRAKAVIRRCMFSNVDQAMNEAALTAGPTLAITTIAAAEMAANALVILDWILKMDMTCFLLWMG